MKETMELVLSAGFLLGRGILSIFTAGRCLVSPDLAAEKQSTRTMVPYLLTALVILHSLSLRGYLPVYWKKRILEGALDTSYGSGDRPGRDGADKGAKIQGRAVLFGCPFCRGDWHKRTTRMAGRKLPGGNNTPESSR